MSAVTDRQSSRLGDWRLESGYAGHGKATRLDHYTRHEVIYLLSLTREDAIDASCGQRDSLAGLASLDSGLHAQRSAEDAPVMLIARWGEVRRARDEIVRAKEGAMIIQLRAAGFPEVEIAKLMGHARLTVRRRQRATVDEILDRLGGPPPDPPPVLANPDLCVKCAQHPRVRLEAVRVRIRGGWRTVEPARQAAVCVECLRPGLRHRVALPARTERAA